MSKSLPATSILGLFLLVFMDATSTDSVLLAILPENTGDMFGVLGIFESY